MDRNESAAAGNFSEDVFGATAIRLSLAGLTLIVLVTSACANTLVIVAFWRFPKLRTNFNFYLLNLSVSDIFLAVFSMSNFCALMLYGVYPFGATGCTLWLYCDWLFSAATENTMMLVSLDRLVSIHWPIWYRNRQQSSRYYSLVVLLAMWLWLNLIILPSLVLARRNVADQANGMCLIDYSAYQDLITTSVILVFWLPEAVTVISYLFIAIKMRTKFHSAKRTAAREPVIIKMKEHELLRAESLTEFDRLTLENSLDDSLGNSERVSIRTGGSNGNGELEPQTKLRKSREQKERRTFHLLSCLVTAVLICCVPADVYHFIAATRPHLATNTFYQVSSFLTFLHCILNPILYHSGLDDMKKAIHKLFGRLH